MIGVILENSNLTFISKVEVNYQQVANFFYFLT